MRAALNTVSIAMIMDILLIAIFVKKSIMLTEIPNVQNVHHIVNHVSQAVTTEIQTVKNVKMDIILSTITTKINAKNVQIKIV